MLINTDIMIESPRGMTIMEAYELYRNNKLYINRRYQRKLLWIQQEKKDLVESILLQYPIPLILLASQTDKHEIFDGMQRLNAKAFAKKLILTRK